MTQALDTDSTRARDGRALRLSAAEVAEFGKNGYLLFHRQVFSPAQIGALYGLLDEHLASKGDKLADELDTPHFDDPRLLDFLLSDAVLDIVEPLLGPDIVLWSSHFLVKEPRVGRATPWHEDSAFWKGRLDNYSKIATVWLALDPVWAGNGCMQVVPQSHLAGGFSDYQEVDESVNSFGRQTTTTIDESKVVRFELGPGEASIHDGRIIHGAHANTSPVRRAGYTMRYLSAAVRVIPEANPGHKIWLARGHDKAGNTYQNA